MTSEGDAMQSSGTAQPHQPSGGERSRPPQAPLVGATVHPGHGPDAQEGAETSSSRLITLLRRTWLPILMFIGTFLGTSIGFAADLTEAIQGWAVPIMERSDPSPRLRIAGSNTVLGEEIGLAAAWAEVFKEEQTWEDCMLGGLICAERTIDVTISGVGSLNGFKMGARDEAELLVASEPMPQTVYQEIAKEHTIECAAVIGYDVVTFVTDINNKGTQISRRELKSILRGSIADWAEVRGEPGPIRILARHGSGTTDLMLRRVAELGQSETEPIPIPEHFITLDPSRESEGGDLRCEDEDDDPADGCEPCGSNDECLDQALNLPGSLYWVSTAWLHTQPPRFMRLILVDYEGWKEYPLYPLCTEQLPGTQEDQEPCFEPDHYDPLLIRPLYMYVIGGGELSPESTELAREFLRYVRGLRGQAILEDHHFYTHFDPPSEVEVKRLPGFDLQEDGTPQVCRE